MRLKLVIRKNNTVFFFFFPQRGEAIHGSTRMDCFAALAMTNYVTPFGLLRITFINNSVYQIQLPHTYNSTDIPLTELPQSIQQQFDAYFADPTHLFELPLYTKGTDFQMRVWQALKEIPVGEAYSYQTLAQKLNSHPRAIGQACKVNPFPIVVPCHRVIAKNNWGGFAGHREGDLLSIKQWLLQHEGYSLPR